MIQRERERENQRDEHTYLRQERLWLRRKTEPIGSGVRRKSKEERVKRKESRGSVEERKLKGENVLRAQKRL
jgi:hypothetical protein